MAGSTLDRGVRRYTCLTPIHVQVGDRVEEWPHVHMLPVTRRIERDWQDGLIQGPNGALEALIDRLTYEPYYVIEEMQHPDVELFNREFALHLPRSISEALGRGEYPIPAALAPVYPGEGGDDEPPGFPEPPPAPPSPPPPRYVDTAPPAAEPPAEAQQAAPAFETAVNGPDESLGTTRQQEEARMAFESRTAATDGRELARDLAAEQPAPEPLAKAVARAAEPPPGFQPSPRNPFDPSPAPPPVSRNRPPTGLPIERKSELPIADALPQTVPRPSTPAAAAPQPRGPAVDPRTGREAVYVAPPEYVPEMSAVGYEEIHAGARNAYGIGDLEP